MFDKKVFNVKCRQWIKDYKWKDKSKEIEEIKAKFRLEEYPYVPHYLVEKDGVLFWLSFFQKGNWSNAKVFEGQGTGLDWYKYKFLQALQRITNIQVGLVMWNEELDKFVFRQLDQMPKPFRFFSGYACRAVALRRTVLAFDCYNCWLNYPEMTDECIHQRLQIKKRKIREMAMWKVSEFADQFVIQTKML